MTEMSGPSQADMMIALRESGSVPSKLEAGEILAHGGWAVFPVPDLAKFDNRLSYLNATTDPGIFREMAEDVMRRHEGRDVNICLAPGKCAVPLVVIDLDGASAIESFRDDAWSRGHADLGMWLRVNTTRPDSGRHAYFVVPEGRSFGNARHRWGGEVRSAKGHVVMPPSTTALGRYTWVGETLGVAPEWIVDGLPASSGGNYRNVGRDELGDWLESLSGVEWTSYAKAAFSGLLDELKEARPGSGGGGRNPTLSKVINRVMDLALDGELSALDALETVKDVYLTLFDDDERMSRNLGGEFVRCVESWTRNKEDLESRLEGLAGIRAWTQARGGAERRDADMKVLEINELVRAKKAYFRASALNWKASIGK